MSKTLCPLPWLSQNIRTNGDIRVCCQIQVSKSTGLLRKENGEVYNVNKDNLEESRNSITLKKIRLEMLKGNHPEACIRCQTEERNGIKSRRKGEMEYWENTFSFEKAVQMTKKDGSIDTKENPVFHYDLRLGNHCNLKCRMCGPTNSDSWYNDYVKTWGTPFFKDTHGKVELIERKNGAYQTKNLDYDWVSSSNFWDQIKLNAPYIRVLYIVGGEPLLIEKHYKLLKTIIEYGNPNQTTIQYNTNLTLLPRKAFDLWKHFKYVNFGVSLDGVGKINDYIRYPSQFEKIEKNLEKLDQSFKNINIWIATTVQVYNILHLPDLILWKIKKRFVKVNNRNNIYNNLLNIRPLHSPKFLNVKMLPKSYKILVEKKFKCFISSFKTWLEEEGFLEKHEKIRFYSNAKTFLNSYLSYMNSEDWSHLVPQFLKYTESLDKIRNEKLQDVLPELYICVSSNIKKL